MITYLDVILHLRPGAQVALVGDDAYENIDWGSEIPIAQADLDAQREAVTLARAKEARCREINAARDAAEEAGFDYLGKRFDSDAQAIKRLYGASMTAQSALLGGVNPDDHFVMWTTADGSAEPLSYAQAAAIVPAMAVIGSTLHQRARALKLQVDAAATVEEVEAIVW